MDTTSDEFVLGLDLDGVVADFYSAMREITSVWKGVPIDDLTPDVTYGLPEWKVLPGEYARIHRFAVTQRSLFSSVPVMVGAAQAIRRLGTEGVRIRIITHRLFIRYFHQAAVEQTVAWLDAHGIPYWDLCFMRDKQMVNADVYLEDAPDNIKKLQEGGCDVIAFSNSTNRGIFAARRADNWVQAEEQIRETYYEWRRNRGLELPPALGVSPSDFDPKI